MDLLLDTHVCVWWADDPTRVADGAREAIGDPANSVWVSAASAWELSIKVRTGKLDVHVRELFDGLRRHGFGVLGMGIDDGVDAGALDWSHRDPFDRMLVAQARRAGHRLVTRDAAILAFLGDDALEA